PRRFAADGEEEQSQGDGGHADREPAEPDGVGELAVVEQAPGIDEGGDHAPAISMCGGAMVWCCRSCHSSVRTWVRNSGWGLRTFGSSTPGTRMVLVMTSTISHSTKSTCQVPRGMWRPIASAVAPNPSNSAARNRMLALFLKSGHGRTTLETPPR